MIVASNQFKGNKAKRDGHSFMSIPHIVIDSASYRGLGYPAVKLLFDIVRQYNGGNNGKLVACAKRLRPLGWNSNATIYKGVRELLDSKLLMETRKGGWPNTAAWYAVTWLELSYIEGMDIQRSAFIRGMYRDASCVPLTGVNKGPIAPLNGILRESSAPLNGAVR